MFRRMLDSRENAPNYRHQELAAGALAGVGKILSAQRKLAEAEDYYRQSLALYRNIGNPKHPQIPVVLKDLIEVLKKQGKLAEAEAVAREAGMQ
jgi:tetratricopeptide (TPR) repeat protein